MMSFYRENKINPLASCWPLLLQLPVFLSLFYLLQGDDFQADVRARSAGRASSSCHDLTEKATGVDLVIMMVLFIGTQIAAGLVMAARVDRQQRIIMFALPLVFAPFIATFPSGPRRLLDRDQRLDARPAVGRAHVLAAAREADPGGDRGGEAAAQATPEEEAPPLAACLATWPIGEYTRRRDGRGVGDPRRPRGACPGGARGDRRRPRPRCRGRGKRGRRSDRRQRSRAMTSAS